MFNNLNTDVIKLIINNLSLKDLIRLRTTNKDNVEYVKCYDNDNIVRIKRSLKNWKKSFPNMTSVNISGRTDLCDEDFKYLDNTQILMMNLCDQISITDHVFRYLSKLRDLNLQGCCGHWIGGHHFTDKMFDYLLNLEKFYIDDNHGITSRGIKKLTKIKDLTISNCSKITNDGLSNLTTLIKLKIYNLNELTDDVFQNLTNLEDLSMTFGHITDRGILYLSNIKKIHISSCQRIKCKDYDKLLKLESLDLSTPINDDNLIYLKKIKNLMLYGCNIKGYRLPYLVNIEELSIYECPIMDEHLSHLLELKKLKKINIFRCNTISKFKKSELKVKLNSVTFDTD